MNKLLDNVSKLSTLFLSRAHLRAQIQDTEDLIAKREVALTPSEGWFGKNADDRAISKAHCFYDDPSHCQLTAILRGFQVDLGKVLAEIEGLQADTSAVEFTIRDETNRVMGGKSILDVLQDCEVEQSQVEVLSEDQLSEDEVKQIEADYAEYVREQEEAEAEAQRLLEKDQLKLDFVPGGVDDPNSENYIPF